jgi:transcriptional regulator with XRE-family HTH domain
MRAMSDDGVQNNPLGEYIRRQREMSEISMRRFAEMSGISNPYLSQIERGHREPSKRVVEGIARSFEMSADALYRQAGIEPGREPESTSVREAIEADTGLLPRQRRALLEVYEGFRAANRKSPRE